jgi:Coenzyme PQQ synthesis protein D (PqqD)
MEASNDRRSEWLQKQVEVPSHVVHRDFGGETVVLNLDSGQYHGLNEVAGVMLQTLIESPTVEAAVERLAVHFNQPRERIQKDVLELCERLAERQLIAEHGGHSRD